MNDTTTEATSATASEPPPSSSATDRPPLVRLRRGRMLAGVAIGLARHLRIDVTLVRIAFVVLAFTGGAGVLAYLAAWVLLPEEEDADGGSTLWTVQRGAPFWIGVGLLALAAIVLVEHTTPFGSSVGTPLVLIAVGAALWKVSQDRAEQPPATPPVASAGGGAGPPPAATPPASGPGSATADAAWTPPPVSPPAGQRGADWRPPPAPSRQRSALPRVTVALVLIALGGGVLLDELDLARFTALDAAATALLVVGAGLVVGAWFGRARGLIGLGVVLVPIVVATSLLQGTGLDVRAGAGERVHVVTAGSGVEPAYALGAGYLEVDLGAVELPPGVTRSRIRLGAGELVLRIPEGTSVVVDATVQLGAISMPGVERGGPGLSERMTFGPREDADATLHLDVELGVGELDVRLVPRQEDNP